MACESCKILVRDALNEMEIPAKTVELGSIETTDDLTDQQKVKLNSLIRKAGLELLEKKQDVLIEKIKMFIIEYVSSSYQTQSLNLSVLLSEKFNLSYNYLSNIFSEVLSTKIEQYVIALKIEQIKELIIYGDDTFSEIAYKLNYSSVAHLSTQFKKSTGLTPSHYKALKEKTRINIENI